MVSGVLHTQAHVNFIAPFAILLLLKQLNLHFIRSFIRHIATITVQWKVSLSPAWLSAPALGYGNICFTFVKYTDVFLSCSL